MTSSVKLLFC